MAMVKLNMLSPDGACKSFDVSANGYARAEGIAVAIVTRADVSTSPLYRDLYFDRRQPYLDILSILVGNDGFTPKGATFPSREAQASLATRAVALAGCNPLDVSYVELHGTGTKAGDGEELNSVDSVYGGGQQRSATKPP